MHPSGCKNGESNITATDRFNTSNRTRKFSQDYRARATQGTWKSAITHHLTLQKL